LALERWNRWNERLTSAAEATSPDDFLMTNLNLFTRTKRPRR